MMRILRNLLLLVALAVLASLATDALRKDGVFFRPAPSVQFRPL